jgi:hypothetical protein
MKKFQKHWIYGYEEVEDAYVFLDVQRRIEETIDDRIMEFDDNPSSELLVEIEERNDAYFFLCDYVELKYGEPSPLKLIPLLPPMSLCCIILQS